MKKVMAYIKKNYIVFTVIIAIVLVIIGSIIIINLIKNNKNKIEVSSSINNLYEYIDISKKSFTGKISFENNKIVNISSETFNVYPNSVIYDENSESLIIPKESLIVFYYQDNLSYRLPKYSVFKNINNSLIISATGTNIVSNNFFIYDGENLYIMPEQSILKVNNEEIILSAFSYVMASYDSVVYYDYKDDKINKLENIQSASLKINNATIDLLKDVTVYNNKVSLLDSNISAIDIYKED